MSATAARTPTQKITQVWLAFLAPLYVISPLAILGLPGLCLLPKPALYLLGFYALSQQLPALLTPTPLLSSALALLRTALMLGLIGLGAQLRERDNVRPLAWGLGVVFLSALLYSLLGGLDVFVGRLVHPYMTSISLGLAGAFGIWLALFTSGRWWWRVPLGLAGFGVLLFTGSRGPLLAALVGVLVGVLARASKQLVVVLLACGLLVLGLVLLGQRLGLPFMNRLTQLDLSGRDLVWWNALSVVQAYPWSGVGSYQLGQALGLPGASCEFFLRADGSSAACPGWVQSLGNPWLIAHSVTLQQLAETGPFGLLGLLALLTGVVVVAVVVRDPLGLAVTSGLLLSTVTDNTLLVPSPFFAETFWLMIGVQLVRFSPDAVRLRFVSLGVLVCSVLFLPLLGVIGGRAGVEKAPVHLAFLSAPLAATTGNYLVNARFAGQPGAYRMAVRLCRATCVTFAERSFSVSGEGFSPLLTVSGPVFRGKQQVRLEVLPAEAGLVSRVLAQHSWQLEGKP